MFHISDEAEEQSEVEEGEQVANLNVVHGMGKVSSSNAGTMPTRS